MVKRMEDQPTDRFEPIQPSRERDSDSSFPKDNISTWLEEGIKYFEKREFQKAIELFEKVLRIDPDNITAYEKVTIARSVQADIDSIAEYLTIGKEYMEKGEWSRAAEEFKAVLAIDEDHEEANKLLGEVNNHLLKQKQTDQEFPDISEDDSDEETLLIKDFDSEFESSYEDSSAHDVMAKAEAALEFESIEDRDRDVVEFRQGVDREIEKAIALYEKGNLQQAEEILKKLSNDFPGHTQINYYLQIIKSKLEGGRISREQSEAEDLLKKGMDELEKENYSAAKSCFEKALKLKPDFKQASLMLEKAKSLSLKTKKPVPQSSKQKRSTQTVKTQTVQTKQTYTKTTGSLFKFIFIGLSAVILIFVTYFFLVKYPEIKVRHYFDEANRLVDEGDLKGALENIKKIETIDPENIDAYALDGNINMKLKNGKEAAFAFQKILSLDPNQEQFLLKLGDAYYLQRNYGSAEKQYYLASKNSSIAVESFYKLGLSQKKMNKIQDAIKSFRNAINKNPDFAKAHYELAKLLESTGQFEDAEKEYLTAIEKEPKFTDVYWDLGNFYNSQKKYEQAIEIYMQPLQWLNISNYDESKVAAKFRFKLGKTYYETGEFEKALDQYNKVMMIEENNADVYDESGRAYFKMGNYHSAIVAWKKAINLAPNRDDFHYRLGTVYHKMGNLKGATEEYLEAVKLNPRNAKALRNLGFVYYHQYKFDDAKNMWEKSLAVNPKQPLIKKKLAEIEVKK